MYWKTAPDLDCKHLHNYNSVAKWMNGVIFTARSKPMPQRPNGGGGVRVGGGVHDSYTFQCGLV